MKCTNVTVCVRSTVSWSSSPSLSPLLGEVLVEDTSLLQCNITDLTPVSILKHQSHVQ